MSVTENSQVDENFETARLVARIADDFRGKDILLLDMRPITPIVDFFIVVTATSQRQMKALGEEVYRNYLRNKKLIDLTETPEPLKEKIIYNYEQQDKTGNKTKVFPYLVEKRCRRLLEDVKDFI